MFQISILLGHAAQNGAAHKVRQNRKFDSPGRPLGKSEFREVNYSRNGASLPDLHLYARRGVDRGLHGDAEFRQRVD